MKLEFETMIMKLENAMNNERGLTLIEVITTMVILAIVVVTAVPNFSLWRDNYQIRSESDHVLMDLLMARTTAIKNNNDVVVTFTEATNTYTILNDINNNGNADAGETLLSRTLQNNVQFGFAGVDITDMDGNSGVTEKVQFGGSDVVTFNARGQASVSGFLFLIHNNHLTANDNGRLRGISVTQATGSAELWQFDTATTAWY